MGVLLGICEVDEMSLFPQAVSTVAVIAIENITDKTFFFIGDNFLSMLCNKLLHNYRNILLQ